MRYSHVYVVVCVDNRLRACINCGMLLHNQGGRVHLCVFGVFVATSIQVALDKVS